MFYPLLFRTRLYTPPGSPRQRDLAKLTPPQFAYTPFFNLAEIMNFGGWLWDVHDTWQSYGGPSFFFLGTSPFVFIVQFSHEGLF